MLSFDWISDVASGVGSYMEAIGTNPINYPILICAWILIEIIDPLLRWWVASPRHKPSRRVRLHELIGIGKRMAAVFWCSLAVWIPLAQPELCDGVIVSGCQTIVHRLGVGATLGSILSGGHWFTLAAVRKIRGQSKRVRIMCAGCKSKVLVSSLSDPCPVCKETPHEVTRT